MKSDAEHLSFWKGPAARLAVGLPAGIALGAPLWHFGVVVALLGGWTALALIFTSWTWILLWPFKADDTKKHASDEEGRLWVVAGLILVGAVASLVGVWYLLKSDREWDWLAVCSVALSWVTIHTLYALIYAKHFYDPLHRDGIDFNSPEGHSYRPCFKDFLYVAFAIGMSFAIPDTNLTSTRMRSIALGQGVLSFLFGAVIIASVVNVLGSGPG